MALLRRGLLIAGLAGLILALPAIGPALDLERRLYFALHGICAQSHNLSPGGVQLPLCARDSGIYLGLLSTLGVIAAGGRGRAGRLPTRGVGLALVALAATMGLDGVNSTLAELGAPHLYPPRDDLRLLTGLGFGVALAVAMLLAGNHALRPEGDLDLARAPVGGWADLAAALAAAGLVALALAADSPLLAWPLALLSALGVTALLTFAVGLPVSAFAGLSGRVRRPGQLVMPGLAGLLVTLLLLAALARWRVGLEAAGLMPPPLIPD